MLLLSIMLFLLLEAHCKLNVKRAQYDTFIVNGNSNSVICKEYGGDQLYDGATSCKCGNGETFTSSEMGGAVKCQNGRIFFVIPKYLHFSSKRLYQERSALIRFLNPCSNPTSFNSLT